MKQVVRWPIFLALALFLLTASLALAATSTPPASKPGPHLQSGSTPTATLTVTDTLTTTLASTSTLVASSPLTVTVQPTATQALSHVVLPPANNPDNAQPPTGGWVYINPGTSQWYKLYDAGVQIIVWVDANGQQGLAMALYAPDQKDLYGKPVGRGSYNKFEPSHDLYWQGYTPASGVGGTWYAVVTNGSNSPISYNLGYKRDYNSVRARCSVCHGFDIPWDECVDNGTPWCEDLQNQYNQP
jgi:hypothetical protein